WLHCRASRPSTPMTDVTRWCGGRSRVGHKPQYRPAVARCIVVAMTTDARHPSQRPLTSRTAHTRTDTVIDVRGWRCQYGDFAAVRGIDITVRRGELFALLGTNGAGKTTARETLEGHRAADDGQKTVLGLDPGVQRRELAKRIGVMFQHSGLMEDLTSGESLHTWAGIHGYPDLDVDRLLTRVHLEHRGNVRTKDLSGGERRRL